MSRALDEHEYREAGVFALGEQVEFDGPYGERLVGEVVRVYNSRTLYHVEVRDKRYEVRP